MSEKISFMAKWKQRLMDPFNASLDKTNWDHLEEEVGRADRSRIFVGTLVMALSLAVITINSLVVEQDRSQATHSSRSRSIASIAIELPRSPEVAKWESAMASQLHNNVSHRVVNALGSKPSELESLIFGTLGGQYTVRLDGGKIYGLEFAQSEVSGYKPKLIGDREQFLITHGGLLPVAFSSLRRAAWVNPDQSGVKETYEFVGDNDQVLGKAQFELDGMGRMLAMTVDTASR